MEAWRLGEGQVAVHDAHNNGGDTDDEGEGWALVDDDTRHVSARAQKAAALAHDTECHLSDVEKYAYAVLVASTMTRTHFPDVVDPDGYVAQAVCNPASTHQHDTSAPLLHLPPCQMLTYTYLYQKERRPRAGRLHFGTDV